MTIIKYHSCDLCGERVEDDEVRVMLRTMSQVEVDLHERCARKAKRLFALFGFSMELYANHKPEANWENWVLKLGEVNQAQAHHMLGMVVEAAIQGLPVSSPGDDQALDLHVKGVLDAIYGNS